MVKKILVVAAFAAAAALGVKIYNDNKTGRYIEQ